MLKVVPAKDEILQGETIVLIWRGKNKYNVIYSKVTQYLNPVFEFCQNKGFHRHSHKQEQVN